MTEQDLKLALAMLEKDCKDGKVPLLDPALVQRPCPLTEGYLQCIWCQGRGWCPSDDLGSWIGALNKAGLNVEFSRHGPVMVTGEIIADRWLSGYDYTIFEAAAQALGIKLQ